MEHLFASGRVVDAILVLTVLEGVALAARGRRDLLANLAAGMCLLLALRLALGGADWHWLALALSGALLAHLAELRQRLWLRNGGGRDGAL